MNIFDKIKIAWKAKTIAEEAYKEAKMITGSTPGWKTTEFWLNLAGQAATLWGAVSGFIPPKWAAIISTSGIAVYTIARTIIKAVSDVKAAQTTTTDVSVTTKAA